MLSTIAYYLRQSKQNIINIFFYINKVAIDYKIKVITQRYLDIYTKIDLYNYGLNNLLYNIPIKDKLISYLLNKGYIRSRKYFNSLLIKSIIKYLKLLTLNNLEKEILYNNKIKESYLNYLFINYFFKDFIIKIIVFKLQLIKD